MIYNSSMLGDLKPTHTSPNPRLRGQDAMIPHGIITLHLHFLKDHKHLGSLCLWVGPLVSGLRSPSMLDLYIIAFIIFLVVYLVIDRCNSCFSPVVYP